MVVIKSDEYSNILNLLRKRNCLQDLLKSDFTVHSESHFTDKRIICDILNNCEGMELFIILINIYMTI